MIGTYSRPTPKGEVGGIWSRPTPKGEVEGDLSRGCTCSWIGACSGGGLPAPGGSAPGGDCSLGGGLPAPRRSFP